MANERSRHADRRSTARRAPRRHPMARLLDVLREDLRPDRHQGGLRRGRVRRLLRAARRRLVDSCLVPAAQVRGARVTTVEGLAHGGKLARGAARVLERGGAQCGICTPGMLMAARELLDRGSHPGEAADPRGARRKHLPLHGLQAHLRVRRGAAASRARRAVKPTCARCELAPPQREGGLARACGRRRYAARRRHRSDGAAVGRQARAARSWTSGRSTSCGGSEVPATRSSSARSPRTPTCGVTRRRRPSFPLLAQAARETGARRRSRTAARSAATSPTPRPPPTPRPRCSPTTPRWSSCRARARAACPMRASTPATSRPAPRPASSWRGSSSPAPTAVLLSQGRTAPRAGHLEGVLRGLRRRGADGLVTAVRIALGGVAPVPLRGHGGRAGHPGGRAARPRLSRARRPPSRPSTTCAPHRATAGA